MSEIVAECYFLDVGQGTSQVIDLGDDSAVVIDCGPVFRPLGELLFRLGIKRIASMILSHNHHDHTGGAVDLARNYRGAIDKVYFLQDRSAVGMQTLDHFSYLREHSKNGSLPTPRFLQQSQIIPLTNDVKLEVLFPDSFSNIDAQKSGHPNHTSGILLLHCGNTRILFSGDAEIGAWREVIRSRNNQPIECDVLAVPHHGGQIVRHPKPNEDPEQFHAAISTDLKWLYETAIQSQTAVISTGSNNSYNHPLPPHVTALRNSGVCVLCTQITTRCSKDIDRFRPSVIDFARRQAPLPARPRSENAGVACAGTVLVQIGADQVQIERLTEHQTAIDTHLTTSQDHPLCRCSMLSGVPN